MEIDKIKTEYKEIINDPKFSSSGPFSICPFKYHGFIKKLRELEKKCRELIFYLIDTESDFQDIDSESNRMYIEAEKYIDAINYYIHAKTFENTIANVRFVILIALISILVSLLC